MSVMCRAVTRQCLHYSAVTKQVKKNKNNKAMLVEKGRLKLKEEESR